MNFVPEPLCLQNKISNAISQCHLSLQLFKMRGIPYQKGLVERTQKTDMASQLVCYYQLRFCPDLQLHLQVVYLDMS